MARVGLRALVGKAAIEHVAREVDDHVLVGLDVETDIAVGRLDVAGKLDDLAVGRLVERGLQLAPRRDGLVGLLLRVQLAAREYGGYALVAFFGGSLVVPCLLVSVVCVVGVIRNVSFRRGNRNAILTLSDGYHEPRLGAECLSRRNGPYAVRIPSHKALVALGAHRLDLARKPDCVQDVSKGGLIAERKLKAQVVAAKLHHVPG